MWQTTHKCCWWGWRPRLFSKFMHKIQKLWFLRVDSGDTSEALLLPGWRVGLEAKKFEGRACLWFPRDRKWRTENAERRARLRLEARASCLSQPGTSPHVSTSCPCKTSQALCGALVCLHLRCALSAGYLFLIRIRFTEKFSKDCTKTSSSWEFSNFKLYSLTEYNQKVT